MPEIAFHTGVADKIGYACRLLRKAHRQLARVRVIGDPAELGLLDKALWTFDAHDFIPHLRWDSGAAVAPALHRTPIWLTPDALAWPEGVEPPAVLVNLGDDTPLDVAAFERVIEIVSTDQHERRAGRARWRRYEAQGHSIQHFAVAQE